MTFCSGDPKPPDSGRKKGTPNKQKPQHAVQAAFAEMALRRMQALDDMVGIIIQRQDRYPINQATFLLRMMTVATRHAGAEPDEIMAASTPPLTAPDETLPATPPAALVPPESQEKPTAQQQFNKILFSPELKGDDFVKEAMRLARENGDGNDDGVRPRDPLSGQ